MSRDRQPAPAPPNLLPKATALLALATLLSSLGSSPSLRADILYLKSGETLEGEVGPSSFLLETDRGTLEVPKSSLSSIVALPHITVMVLIDGTELEGTLAAPTVQLQSDLFSRHVDLADIETVSFATPTITVPAGTAVALVLGERLGSRGAHPGREVILCAADAVRIDGHPVIAERAPGIGVVLGGGSRSNLSGGGQVVFRADVVLATDGTTIPLTGNFDEEAGVDAGTILQGGLLGLGSSGEDLVLNAGFPAPAATREGAEIARIPAAPDEPRLIRAAEICQEAFALVDIEGFIPTERIRSNRDYVALDQPLRLSIPISSVVSETGGSLWESFRNVVVADTSLRTLTIEPKWRRGGGLRLDVTSELYVRPSHDKRVSLQLELMAGDRLIARDTLTSIDAEEKRSKEVKSRFEIGAGGVAALRAAERPELRITMTVVEG